MSEDPVILRMNIAHYQAMLRLVLDDRRREAIERLLAEAFAELALTQSRQSGR
jgi:hypothetical protein